MNDQEKKVAQEETPKDQKIELTDEEVDKVAGGTMKAKPSIVSPNPFKRR